MPFRVFLLLIAICITIPCKLLAQTPTIPDSSIFTRITRELTSFKPDTTAPPNDAKTEKVKELRTLRGGFNINEAISYKLTEDSTKGDITPQQAQAMRSYFLAGQGKTWLDNAVIRIYRDEFTEPELDELIRFYKTSAGQKLAKDFPVIMLKSITAGETVKAAFQKQQDTSSKFKKQ